MPTSWSYEPILRSFIIASEGSTPYEEFFVALDEVLTQPQARGRMRLLIDNSRLSVPTSEIIREGLTGLVRYRDRLRHSTILFVVPPEGEQGEGRMATVPLDDRLAIEVFNDMASAVVSLTMDEAD